jgi:hypothetical protein
MVRRAQAKEGGEFTAKSRWGGIGTPGSIDRSSSKSGGVDAK